MLSTMSQNDEGDSVNKLHTPESFHLSLVDVLGWVKKVDNMIHIRYTYVSQHKVPTIGLNHFSQRCHKDKCIDSILLLLVMT